MMNFFFEYINYEKLGQIDNSHLVKADSDTTNYADNADCIKLSEIHGKAVDFPKTGYCPEVDPKLLVSVYPDFMEKEEN
jgi:RNA-dependent RNA polymerase